MSTPTTIRDVIATLGKVQSGELRRERKREQLKLWAQEGLQLFLTIFHIMKGGEEGPSQQTASKALGAFRALNTHQRLCCGAYFLSLTTSDLSVKSEEDLNEQLCLFDELLRAAIEGLPRLIAAHDFMSQGLYDAAIDQLTGKHNAKIINESTAAICFCFIQSGHSAFDMWREGRRRYGDLFTFLKDCDRGNLLTADPDTSTLPINEQVAAAS